jgi:3-oxoacyl-[acyl-carrier-protein] synthase II
MGPLTDLEQPLPAGRDGGQAPSLPPDFCPDLPREARYLRWAILAALSDAGLAQGPLGLPYSPERCGIVLGTTLHGMRSAGKFLRDDDPSHLGTFLAGDVIRLATQGMAASGPAITTCSACSSSLGSVALASTLLKEGMLDLVIAGGYDPVSEYAYAGFNSLRLVAETPLRPFARGRQGMKLSEGYGILVLQRDEDVRRRGGKVWAIVAGCGESADAHHLTQPHPQGEGAARAMREAIRIAGLTPPQVSMAVAHATGTPDNDAGEHAALRQIWEQCLPNLPVVAFKSHLGHTLGAAGAMELILAAKAIQQSTIPPCAGLRCDDIEFSGLAVVTGEARRAKVSATLSTSLGFGGANTSVVMRPAGTSCSHGTALSDDDVVITGVGAVIPGAIGNAAIAQRFTGRAPVDLAQLRTLAEEELTPLLNARRVRRMSEYVKLLLTAATFAINDAAVSGLDGCDAPWPALLGTMHGSAAYSETYYRQVVSEGIAAANPMLFAEGVPNAASAHLSLMLGLKGGCQTLIGTRTCGLDALLLAAARIREGRWQRAVIGAAEEFSPLVSRVWAHFGLCNESAPSPSLPFAGQGGFACSAGSAVLILESRRSAEARGARIRAQVIASAARGQAHPTAVAEVLRAIGNPSAIVSSANGSRIDAIERAGMIRAANNSSTLVSSVYGHMGETFSAAPLLGVVATLLRQRLPSLLGGSDMGRRLRSACGEETVGDFAVLATDPGRSCSAVRLRLSEGVGPCT